MRRHELEVIDHDQAQIAVAGLDAARLGAHLHDRAVRVVVDEERRFGESSHGLVDPRPLVLTEATRLQLARGHTGFGREQPLGELEVAHLHREEHDRFASVHGHVLGEAEGERRLALAGAGGDDRERRRLQTEQDGIEIVVPRRGADNVALTVVERLELVHRLFECRVQRHERVRDALLGDLEDRRLGAIERLVDGIVARVCHFLNLARGLDQPAQHRQLADDLGVVRGVRRRRRRRLDPQQHRATAELVELGSPSQLLGDRDRINRLTAAVQRERRLVDRAVCRLVEIGRLEMCLDRGGDRLAAKASSPRAATPRPRGCAAGCGRRNFGDAPSRRDRYRSIEPRSPYPVRTGPRASRVGPVGRKRYNRVSLLWIPTLPVHMVVDCDGYVRHPRGCPRTRVFHRLWTTVVDDGVEGAFSSPLRPRRGGSRARRCAAGPGGRPRRAPSGARRG